MNTKSIKGILTNCNTEEKTIIDIEYKIIETFGENPEGTLNKNKRRIFQLINGVTGYESFYIDTDFSNVKRMCKNGWHANVGTKGSWNDLFIPPEEMSKVDWDVKSND